MSNECIPYFAGAKQITVLAGSTGIGGKRFVTVSGPLAVGLGTDGGVPTGVIPATAGVPVTGVGAQDNASGISAGVFTHGIVPVTTSAAVTGGTFVMTDPSGYAIPWIPIAQISAPSAPTVTPEGTTGSTSYSYELTITDGNGETTASSAGSTTTGNATLSATNYNQISFSAPAADTAYNIYRTAGGAAQGLIATGVTGTTFNDTGIAAGRAAPTTNTTAGGYTPAGFCEGDTASGSDAPIRIRE